MRLATWNVNSLKARLPRVEAWLADVQPDVLCMQETKLADSAFPAMAFQALGYDAVHHGEGRWNGVAIVSRVGIEDPANGFTKGDESFDREARLLSATCAGVRVVSVYVPNGRSLDDPHYEYKLGWLERLHRHLEHDAAPDREVVVAGDFNIAPDDRDVYDPAKFVGATHTSQPERDRLRELLDWGLEDVFRRQHEQGGAFSWWDYRAGDFHQGRGMRIDLVLASAPLAQRVEWCVIDRNARKGTSPSDHAPVIVDLA